MTGFFFVACGGALGLRAWRSYTPMYASEVTFTIQMDSNSLTDIGGSTSYYDKATAEQLTKTFPYLVQSELMQTKLRQAMGVDRLNGSISAQTVENTNLFSLRVTSTSAQDAYDILMAVTQVYPQVADYVIGNTQMNLLTVPEVARAPYNAFRPARTVCKGAALGCALGLAVVLLYALTRRSIRDPEDIRRRLNLQCIATLPRVTFKRRGREIDRRISIRNQRVTSAFQESVRSMRMKFLRQAQKQHAQVILVTSTLPGEGKTTVAVNLALSLSQSGARVILVDLDLRKPSVKKALGVETPSRGVPELLSGEEKESVLEALIPVEGSTLRLLAGDRPAQDARQQLTSRRLGALVDQLRREGPTSEELERAREQSKANVVMGLESTQSRMSHAGRSLLFSGEILTPEQIIAAYDSVTHEDVVALAQEIFRWDQVSLSAVGQVRTAEAYRALVLEA